MRWEHAAARPAVLLTCSQRGVAATYLLAHYSGWGCWQAICPVANACARTCLPDVITVAVQSCCTIELLVCCSGKCETTGAWSLL